MPRRKPESDEVFIEYFQYNNGSYGRYTPSLTRLSAAKRKQDSTTVEFKKRARPSGVLVVPGDLYIWMIDLVNTIQKVLIPEDAVTPNVGGPIFDPQLLERLLVKAIQAIGLDLGRVIEKVTGHRLRDIIRNPKLLAAIVFSGIRLEDFLETLKKFIEPLPRGMFVRKATPEQANQLIDAIVAIAIGLISSAIPLIRTQKSGPRTMDLAYQRPRGLGKGLVK